MLAVHHDFPLETARQLKTFQKDVSWIEVSFARITIAAVLVVVARIVLVPGGAGTTPQFDPGHLYVSCVVALQISRIRIKVHKTPPSLVRLAVVRGPRPRR